MVTVDGFGDRMRVRARTTFDVEFRRIPGLTGDLDFVSERVIHVITSR